MQAINGCIRFSFRSLTTEYWRQGGRVIGQLSQELNKKSVSMSSSPTYTAEYLSKKLQQDLEAEHVEIEDLSNCGCGMKFDATLVSPKFEGKPILQRQRLVNQILVEEMKHIHAFTMRTLTPTQWKESLSKKDSFLKQ